MGEVKGCEGKIDGEGDIPDSCEGVGTAQAGGAEGNVGDELTAGALLSIKVVKDGAGEMGINCGKGAMWDEASGLVLDFVGRKPVANGKSNS